MSQRRAGRIRPHERDTDDTVEILGANIEVSAEHTASVRATERQDLNEKNKRNYCLELSTENLKANGIITLFEEPKPVGEQDVLDNWKSSEWRCPHIFGGIPVNVPSILTNIFDLERDCDGKFLSLVGLTGRA